MPFWHLKIQSLSITLLYLIVAVGTIPKSAAKVLLFFDICKLFCIFLHFFCIFLQFTGYFTNLAYIIPSSSPISSHTMRGVNPCGAPSLCEPHRRAECSRPLSRPLSLAYTLAPTTRAGLFASLRSCSVGDMRRPARPLATPKPSPLGVFIIPCARGEPRVMARLRWVCASLQRPPSGIAGRRRAPFGCRAPRVPTPEGLGVSALPMARPLCRLGAPSVERSGKAYTNKKQPQTDTNNHCGHNNPHAAAQKKPSAFRLMIFLHDLLQRKQCSNLDF